MGSARASLIFFLLSDLFMIHELYHFSLAAYTAVFLRAIDLTGKVYTGPQLDAAASLEKQKQNPLYRFKVCCQLMSGALKGDLDGGRPVDKSNQEFDLDARLDGLTETITHESFSYARRGLFEQHKLIFSSQLAFKILLKSEQIEPGEHEWLLTGKIGQNLPTLSTEMSQWLQESNWALANGLAELPRFNKLVSDMEREAKHWKEWCNSEAPEVKDPPGAWAGFTPHQKLLLLRALRPDRVPSALRLFVKTILGEKYITDPPFDVFDAYKYANCEQPMFFYLFPGSDVLRDMGPLIEKKGWNEENGKLIAISMGQGQEPVAEQALDTKMKEGGWVLLQNIHLMTTWVGTLERKLESKAHADFRCFLSAEPDPDPTSKAIPESIMQASVKVSNMPPQDLKSILVRAWGTFDQATLDNCSKKRNFRTILFTLCFFHSMELGRRRFGTQGWSRAYGFNVGDLLICKDVLTNQLNAKEKIPWEDIKYVFGEIMYGGHITDNWDRRTNSTYLEVLMQDMLFKDGSLCPGFKSKVEGTFDEYAEYVKKKLPLETPVLYGLHPNAEIGFLISEQNTLFSVLLDLSGAGGGSSGDDTSTAAAVMVEKLLAKCPEPYNAEELHAAVKEKTPYMVVMLQEVDRMNNLVNEIRRSLSELKLGLEGALNISDAMEVLTTALLVNRVPATWEKVAYSSLLNLASWFLNVVERAAQLNEWTSNLATPKSLWICGLFNPQAFLTAIMQVTARANEWPLDQVCLQTDVTDKELADVDEASEEGWYIHGIYLEGARWEMKDKVLRDQVLKELHPLLPVIRAFSARESEKRDCSKGGFYECPMYLTSRRGGDFVFAGQLKTDEPNHKWVLAGVAGLFSV